MGLLDVKYALRAVLPAAWLDRVRFRWHQWKFGSVNRRFKQAHPDVAWPPDYFVYETYRLNYAEYWADGHTTAGEIISLFKKHGWSTGPVTILDWGCGPGRVLRHLATLLPEESLILGADYNPQYVAWCRANLDGITAVEHPLAPPLPLHDAVCDAVFGLSILTHLDASSQQSWLCELYRITKPGGLVLLTTHGVRFRDKLSAAEQVCFDQGKLVVREQGKEGHRIFASFQPKVWMEAQVAQAGWSVVDWIAGGSPSSIHGEQDTWVLRRPLEPA